jgi:hypothetical protein
MTTNTLTLPVSKEFYTRFQDYHNSIKNEDSKYVAINKDRLEQLEETVRHCPELFKDPIAAQADKVWCGIETERVKVLLNILSADIKWLVMRLAGTETDFESEGTFMAGFLTETQAEQHIDYLEFNDAIQLALT